MSINTNPQAFVSGLPVHTVTHIDRSTGIVTLTGSDGTLRQERLDSWGPLEVGQPVIGTKVQYLDNQLRP